MKKLFLLSVIFILSIDAGICAISTLSPLQAHPPLHRNYNGNINPHYNRRFLNPFNRYHRTSVLPASSDTLLNSMERRILSGNFPLDTPEGRVARLEQQMFGTIRSGDLRSRMKALNNASRNYGGYNNYNYPYSPRQSVWSTLGSIMSGGVPTGITPQITADPYDMGGFGYNEMWRDNRGNYFYNNQNFNSGVGVKILD